MLSRFARIFNLSLLICVCTPVFAQEEFTEINSILPFHWKDTPIEMISHLTDLGVQFINGGNNGEPLESPSVPFLGYRAKFYAEFSGQSLKTLTFTVEQKGPQEGLFFIYNDIDKQLRAHYGTPHALNLLSRETVWRSSDRNRALWTQMVLEETAPDKTEGTLQGSIALRGTTTGDGKQASNNAMLDVSGVKFTLNTARTANYKMIIQVTFQNMTPGQAPAADEETAEESSQEEETAQQDNKPESGEESNDPAEQNEEKEAE